MPVEPRLSVVIATSLHPSRVGTLVRGVHSLTTQEGCVVIPIIVVNGPHFDPAALEYWKTRPDVRLFQLEEGDWMRARRFGRERVDTDYFGFLDDDDLYLPDGARARLAPMLTDPAVDVVVGNGVIEGGGQERPALADPDLHRSEPLVSLASENWMPSAAALFRTETVPLQYFEHPDRHMEWTALAFRLAADGKNIVFVDNLTFRITDTPGSLSKSLAYAVEAPETMRRLLDIPVGKEARRAWRRKYGAALHGLAEFRWNRGEHLEAYKAHFRSLLQPGGLRYLAYTRHLIRP